MPGWDSNGNFTRVHNWQADDAADIGIVSDRHDAEDDNFAQGLNNTFCRDGQAPATGEWNLDNHQINNVGAGTEDGDAINLGQLTGSGPTGTPDFKKSINLVGSDLNGRVNFRAATGVQGIGWFGADLGLFARLDEDNKVRDRLVLNNKFDGTGTEVMIFDDDGNLGVTSLTYNLSKDTDGDWRAINPGYVGRLYWTVNGGLALQNIDAATVTDQYVLATLRDALKILTEGGNTSLTLNTMATGDHYNNIYGDKGGTHRWEVELGTPHPETGGSTGFGGSHFYINAYNNSGGGSYTPFYIMRDTGQVGIPYGITGTLKITGGYLDFGASAGVIGSTADIFLRPNGVASGSGQVQIAGSGYVKLGNGLWEKSGTTGSYGTQIYNFLYVSDTDNRCYIGTSLVGRWTSACDYRIKREVRPIDNCWERVKALRPVEYKPAAFGDGHKESDELRWGFIAHELQEALLPSAATGVKDEEEDIVETAEDGTTKVVGKQPVLQGPNVMAVVAALCSALQEAQLRIEALEARLAA